MDETIMLEWELNTFDFDQLEPLSPQPINQSISCDKLIFEDQSFSNNDQVGFFQLQESCNSWDRNSKSKSVINLDFDRTFKSKDIGSGDHDLISNGLKDMVVNKRLIPPKHGQDHIIAERKRREKLNQRFIELSSVIPRLKKADKASILIHATKYLKELQRRVKVLEIQNPKSVDSSVLVKTSSLSFKANHDSGSSCTEPLPKIEARILEDTVLLISILCKNVKGVLVAILSEIEEQNLTVTHTNLISFPRFTASITVTAKFEEGFQMSIEAFVRKLNSTLKRFGSRNQGN